MPQSYSAVAVHIVFATKQRHPYLADPTVRAEMHAYLGGTLNALGCPIIAVGGVEDHVHLLTYLGRPVALSDCVRELKKASTAWARGRDRRLAEFTWQTGFAAFSVSPSGISEVKRYIGTQEEHHRKLSFEEEFRALLKEHGIEFDEKNRWE